MCVGVVVVVVVVVVAVVVVVLALKMKCVYCCSTIVAYVFGKFKKNLNCWYIAKKYL